MSLPKSAPRHQVLQTVDVDLQNEKRDKTRKQRLCVRAHLVQIMARLAVQMDDWSALHQSCPAIPQSTSSPQYFTPKKRLLDFFDEQIDFLTSEDGKSVSTVEKVLCIEMYVTLLKMRALERRFPSARHCVDETLHWGGGGVARGFGNGADVGLGSHKRIVVTSLNCHVAQHVIKIIRTLKRDLMMMQMMIGLRMKMKMTLRSLVMLLMRL